MTDDIQVRRSGKWGDATLVERQPSGRVIVRVDGKRRGFDPCDVREARGPRVPSVRAVDPDEEEEPNVRSVGTVRAPIVEQPKRLTPRSPKFLDLLRRRPCDHCGAPPRSEAAHFGGRGAGIKSSDFEACSLCSGPNGCHPFWHMHGVLPGLDREESMIKQWAGAMLALASFVGPEEAARAIAAWIEEGRRER